MKKIGLMKAAMLFSVIALATGIYIADLYTHAQVKKLGGIAAQKSARTGDWNTYKVEDVGSQPGLMHLGDLLYANIHANAPEGVDWWGAGTYTQDSYKDGWRKTIASNPKLAGAALKLYGKTYFTAFEDNLEIIKAEIINDRTDGAQRAPTLNKYETLF